ncbi:MAG: hypothetical protein Q7U52_01485 [Hydrogenophaga sp.]|nr:hypothetical protein [Hydrogenophaga sp.]MDO9146344.1 hypothetical protein [Hydrogenophaga sp.]MDO9604645.1 hypothetical protein [Hydrogenophaga sp.]
MSGDAALPGVESMPLTLRCEPDLKWGAEQFAQLSALCLGGLR